MISTKSRGTVCLSWRREPMWLVVELLVGLVDTTLKIEWSEAI